MELNIKDKENLDFLKKKIKELKIFNPENYTDTFLIRRIECRLRATNINSYLEYGKLIDQSEKEKESLKKELTINVTSFFRDIKTYEMIRDEIIPLIIENKKTSESILKNINVWSAGAASGEEAYSLAMIFKESLGTTINKYNISITGTDIDQEAIEEAKKGIYQEQQLKEAPLEYVKKYFECENKICRIKEEIKKMVKFEKGDIFSSIKPKNIDLLLCRNTVIYFNADAKAKLYRDFYNIINKNGFLVLGKTEILLGEARDLFQIYNSTERIYCKE